MSHVKDFLLTRKRDLLKQLEGLKPVQDELTEVERLLATYEAQTLQGCTGCVHGCANCMNSCYYW